MVDIYIVIYLSSAVSELIGIFLEIYALQVHRDGFYIHSPFKKVLNFPLLPRTLHAMLLISSHLAIGPRSCT